MVGVLERDATGGEIRSEEGSVSQYAVMTLSKKSQGTKQPHVSSRFQ